MEAAIVFASDLVEAAIVPLESNDKSDTFRTALARHFGAPTWEERKQIIRSYRFILAALRDRAFRCAATADEIKECQSNPEAGITAGFSDGATAVMCPAFWLESPKLSCRAISLIHEAAHNRGMAVGGAHPPYRDSSEYAKQTTSIRMGNPDVYAYFAADIGRETVSTCTGTFASEAETIEIHSSAPKPEKK
jgi:hypothetical protein